MCDDVCMWTAGYQHETIQIHQVVFFFASRYFVRPIWIRYLCHSILSVKIYLVPEQEISISFKLIPIYIYTHHYTNYTPIVQILLEKKYTRLHPLTLWLPRSWVPLVASSTISWWRRWVCREHMRVSPPKKWVSMHEKISKTPIPIISTFFLPKILQLCPDLSPLRPSPLCEASVGIRKHQCHGSRPKTIHSFPPIRDMEKPNTSAWHIFWYMFIYILYYIILYYVILYYIILYYIYAMSRICSLNKSEWI